MTKAGFSIRFEELREHRTVVVQHIPEKPVRAQLLVLPAFGDEMNQMRRMVRLACEALCRHGVSSTVFDLHGTGDSSASFEEATVERWIDDAKLMLSRLDACAPTVLLGCRLGAALAIELTHSVSLPIAGLVGWAPLLNGKAQLSMLLRAQQVAAEHRDVASRIRSQWAAGKIVWLSGYPFAAQLAVGLERLSGSRAPRVAQAALLDVRVPTVGGNVQPTTATARAAASWSAQGVKVRASAFEGPAFWNVPDLVDMPTLLAATIDAVKECAGIVSP